jgi:hypothetical protein
MSKELMIFEQPPFVVVYRGSQVNSLDLDWRIPGWLRMPKEDQKILEEALDAGRVVFYRLKTEMGELTGKKLSTMDSPMFSKVMVENENGELAGENTPYAFHYPALDGPVVSFPLEVLLFIYDSLSAINTRFNLLPKLSSRDLNFLAESMSRLS